MEDLSMRIEELSPKKRELLEMLLKGEDGASDKIARNSYTPPRTPEEITLARIWEESLGVLQIGVDDNFFDLGGDSIISIQIIARARKEGIHITNRQLFEHPTIAKLSAVVSAARGDVSAEQGSVTGAVTLAPIQHWFFEQNLPDINHWNQAVMLEARRKPEGALLEKSLHLLAAHHDALRLRFDRTEEGWRQYISDADGAIAFSSLDFSTAPETEMSTAIARKMEEFHDSLNITHGPLVKVVLFECGAGKPDRLLITAHHLLVDGVSFRILVEDLQAIYHQLESGEVAQAPPKTTSFKEWTRLLSEYARTPEAQQDLRYWLGEAPASSAIPSAPPPLALDHPTGVNSEESARTVSCSLSEEETDSLLHKVPAASRTQVNHVLLGALAHALFTWTRDSQALIDVEGHGREEIFENVDLTRTVGWFTSIFPVWLDLKDATGPADVLRHVKERVNRIPSRGLSYGVLRYLSEDAVKARMKEAPQSQIIFNYMGQFDHVLSESAPFRPSEDSPGPVYGPRNIRPHLLQVVVVVINGKLRLNWTYSENIHRRETIEPLALRMTGYLREIIDLCARSKIETLAPSDFPEAELSWADLNKILSGDSF